MRNVIGRGWSPVTQDRIEPRAGVFWRADDPDRERPGTLVRGDGQWELLLHGGLRLPGPGTDGLTLVEPSLIYGFAGNTIYTLRHAYYRTGTTGPFEDDLSGEMDLTQKWVAYELVEAMYLPDDGRLSSMSFQLTCLEEFWNVTGLVGTGFNRDTYVKPAPLSAQWGPWSIRLEISLSSRSGRGLRSRVETPRVVVTNAAGFTLEEVQTVIEMPMRALLSVCLNRPVTATAAALVAHPDDESNTADAVPEPPSYAPDTDDDAATGDDQRPEPNGDRFGVGDLDSVPPSPGRLDPGVGDRGHRPVYAPGQRPKLTADTVDFATVVPAWLELAAQTLMPMGSALTRDDAPTTPLQNLVVSQVNAAETLHRAINPTQPDTSFADMVKQHLAERPNQLPSKQRADIVSALKNFDEPNLEQRLRQLALSVGEQTATWLLGGQLNNWALVAATIRNALAHGYPTSHRVEIDIGALAGVNSTVRAITHLAMLTHCGVPAGQPLADLLADDPHFASVANQRLADWATLAARIRGK